MTDPTPVGTNVTPVIVQQPSPVSRWTIRLLAILLVLSVMANVSQFAAYQDYSGGVNAPYERFHSGTLSASRKIARLTVDFTIMPPFTQRILDTIDVVADDDSIDGVLLVVDSPGGLVSDSHEIYHRLKELAEKKPIFVSMGGIAASGGYYVAMAAGAEGKIYAQPTTWTGSIGVIMPRYDLTGLADKVGVESDSMSTGPLKDTLNPLKEMSAEEREVWRVILEESFDRFLEVIDQGRPDLDLARIRELATGQVYTSRQALENGLVDAIGYEEDAIDALQKKLGLEEVRVVEYEHPQTFVDMLMSAQVSAPSTGDVLGKLLESSVPRAMYLFGRMPGLSTMQIR